MPNHVTNRIHVTGDEAENRVMLEEIKQEETGIAVYQQISRRR